MLQVLDEPALRRWVAACCEALDTHRAAIDHLNVFPVPDADTGTNLLATMRAAAEALPPPDASLPRSARAMAAGALRGARGNSGIVLSQVLRALADAVGDSASITGPAIREALRAADARAREAIAEPVEGTVLTVLRTAGEGSMRCGSSAMADVVGAARSAAAAAVEATPRQLAALDRAGVVDAGGQGLLLVLAALEEVISGVAVPIAAGTRRPDPGASDQPPRSPADTGCAAAAVGAYEVMYLLDTTDEPTVGALRAALTRLGSSVAVVGDGAGMWHVHVHCDDVGAAIEAGIETGRPQRIRVVPFADHASTTHAVLAMGDGSGLVELLRAERAEVVAGTSTSAELLAAIHALDAVDVTVLPDSVAALRQAQACAHRARQQGRQVRVVPSVSPVQGLVALAVHDPLRPVGDDVIAMTDAVLAGRRGEVTRATGRPASGQGGVLGWIGDDAVVVTGDPVVAACEIIDRLLVDEAELLTVLLGAQGGAGVETALREHVRHQHPEVDLTVYDGGVPGRVLLVGVE